MTTMKALRKTFKRVRPGTGLKQWARKHDLIEVVREAHRQGRKSRSQAKAETTAKMSRAGGGRVKDTGVTGSKKEKAR